MKLSLNWIREFVDLSGISIDEIQHKTNTSICEIESCEPFLPYLNHVYPALIQEVHPHPNAKQLWLTKVYCQNQTIQVITNCSYLKKNDIVACALPGCNLNGKTIQTTSIQGIESQGVFLSAKDLGIGEDSSGVFVLNAKEVPLHSIQGYQGNLLTIQEKDWDPSQPISIQMGFQDTILEIDNKSITHRPDLWSHFGFARELAAQFQRKIFVSPLETTIPDSEFSEQSIPVIQNNNALSYYAVAIYGVQVAESNLKIRSRLILCGQKPISSVVDISNYLLLECGQPTHFFDKSKLTKGNLQVAPSRKGESIHLLDGTHCNLEEGILCIKNDDIPVAIAGVMGGWETAVSNSTRDLVLESAIFRREDIRRSIRSTGIRSEAAIRYEKGLDTFTCIPIIHRAIAFLRQIGNTQIQLGKIHGYDHEREKKTTITLSLDFIQKKLGKSLDPQEPETILQRLGFSVLSRTVGKNPQDTTWEFLVPRYRQNYDVTIPEDLVEEIGRTIGYDQISTQPLAFPVETPIPNPLRELERKWRQHLTNVGFFEVYNYSFQSPEDARFEENYSDEDLVRIQNEMPYEQSVLRTSIYPSLLKNAISNQDRFEKFGIYELGRTYIQKTKDSDGLPKEFRKLGILYLGPGKASTENTKDLELEFLKVRMVLEKTFYQFGFRDWNWKVSQKPYFHPQASIGLRIGNRTLGEMGIFHNRLSDQWGLRKRPILFQLDLEEFLEVLQENTKKSYFQNPSPYPQSYLDISLLLPKKQSTQTYAQIVKESNIPELEDIWVYDIFEGSNLPEGKKSVTYRILLVPYERTFSHERIREITDQLVQIANRHDFPIRT